MSLHLQASRFGGVAFLVAALSACGSHPPDPDDGGLGTGGSGGATGSGGTGTGGAGGTNPCECSTAVVRWWMDGGLALLRDRSELYPCQTFVLTREAMVTPPGTRACKQELNCANAVNAWNLNVAIAHPDVQQAIAGGRVLYGEDPRPVDGQVMAIEIGVGSRIEVGNPCRSATCNPIPPGVDTLADLLTALTTQELARESCRMTFPPLP